MDSSEVLSAEGSASDGQQDSVRVGSICSITCEAPTNNLRYSPFAEASKAVCKHLGTKHKVTGPGMFAVGTGHVEWRTWLKDQLHPSATVFGLQLEQLCTKMHQHLMTDACLRSQGSWATSLAADRVAVVVQRSVLSSQQQRSMSVWQAVSVSLHTACHTAYGTSFTSICICMHAIQVVSCTAGSHDRKSHCIPLSPTPLRRACQMADHVYTGMQSQVAHAKACFNHMPCHHVQ